MKIYSFIRRHKIFFIILVLFADVALVGEAITLAMRTNYSK